MIFEQRADVGMNTTLSVYNTEYWDRVLRGLETDSGIKVTESVAMGLSVVFRCVTLVASIGSLPLKYYQRLEDGGKEPANGEPLWRLLHDMPNPEMTSVEFWEMMFGHAALRYNAYAQVIRDQNDNAQQLWPLNPTRMKVERRRGNLIYRYENSDGREVIFPARDIFHLRGMMNDGLVGISPFQHSKNAMGLRAGQEKFQSSLMKNRASMPFVYVLPGKLKTNEARKNLEKELEQKYGGAVNAGKSPVLEQGLDIKTVGMSAEDAQALEQAKFSVAEIARFYGVPLHKLMELDRATFSNIEEQNTDWVVDTVRPWAKRAEAALRRSVIPERQKNSHFAEFLLDDLLRGNTEMRWSAYQNGLSTGVFSINDVRKKENLNPIENGDKHLVPLNMIPLDMAGVELESSEPEPERSVRTEKHDEQRSKQLRLRLRAANRVLFRDAYARISRREINDLRNNLDRLNQRDEGDFLEWVQGFYEELKDGARQLLTPATLAYAQNMWELGQNEAGGDVEFGDEQEEFARALAGSRARSYVAIHQSQIERDMEDENPRGAIESRLSTWDEQEGEHFADSATVDVGEAIVRSSYLAAGIAVLRWTTVGDNCPLCNKMRGKTVKGRGSFLGKNQTLSAEGVKPFVSPSTIKSPPLHNGCDCMLTPGG